MKNTAILTETDILCFGDEGPCAPLKKTNVRHPIFQYCYCNFGPDKWICTEFSAVLHTAGDSGIFSATLCKYPIKCTVRSYFSLASRQAVNVTSLQQGLGAPLWSKARGLVLCWVRAQKSDWHTPKSGIIGFHPYFICWTAGFQLRASHWGSLHSKLTDISTVRAWLTPCLVWCWKEVTPTMCCKCVFPHHH